MPKMLTPRPHCQTVLVLAKLSHTSPQRRAMTLSTTPPKVQAAAHPKRAVDDVLPFRGVDVPARHKNNRLNKHCSGQPATFCTSVAWINVHVHMPPSRGVVRTSAAVACRHPLQF